MRNGTVYELRWGSRVDWRTISGGADRDGRARSYAVHPEQVAAAALARADYLRTERQNDAVLPFDLGGRNAV